jgi:hypothetical protein
MNKTTVSIMLFSLAVTLAACTTPSAPTPDTTPTPSDSATPAETADTTSDTADPTTGQPTVTISTEAVPAYKIFLIAPEDNGRLGKQIGCGDSVVSVDGQATAGLTPLSPITDRLKAAYSQILTDKAANLGMAGYRNFLADSTLTVDDILFSEGSALIKLSGNLTINGTCDNPRIETQLVETALQFPDVREVTIMINGKALQDYLSLKGS